MAKFGIPLPNLGTINPITPISWTSSDTTVAQIDANGNLTGSAVGTTRITGTYRGQHGDLLVEVYSTAPDSSLTVTVVNSAVDVAPFWLQRPTDVWRQREVQATVTPTDSFTTVETVDMFGYDIYGTLFNSIPFLQPTNDGTRTTNAYALFFDDPRAGGVPELFQTAGRLFIMQDEVFVHIVTINQGVERDHWVRAPLTP